MTYATDSDPSAAIERALEIIESYGGIDGSHHKEWVIDQVVRALTGSNYPQWVADMCQGSEGHDTYTWSLGKAP